MVEDKKINKNVGLKLMDKVIETKEQPSVLAEKMGLFAGVSKEQIVELLNKLKSENAKVCEDYKKEPERVIGFIVGFVQSRAMRSR